MNTDQIIANDIDYNLLHTEEEFTKYQAFINSLAPTDAADAPMHDFELFEARPVFKILNEGTRNSQQLLIGFEKRNPDPIKSVRIQVRNARMHNAQIESAQGRAGQGTFYLLKKG